MRQGTYLSDLHVGRVVRYAAAVFIFRQAHIAVFTPIVAPPVLQDPLGRRVSYDEHRVVHRVRTAQVVVVDAFTANKNIVRCIRVEIVIGDMFKRSKLFLLDKKAGRKEADDASGAKHPMSDSLIYELKIRMGEEEGGGELHSSNWKARINDIELWANRARK